MQRASSFTFSQSWALAHFFEVRYPLSIQFFPLDRWRSCVHFLNFPFRSSLKRSSLNQWFAERKRAKSLIALVKKCKKWKDWASDVLLTLLPVPGQARTRWPDQPKTLGLWRKKFGRKLWCKNFLEVELIIVEISLYGNHTVLQIVFFQIGYIRYTKK